MDTMIEYLPARSKHNRLSHIWDNDNRVRLRSLS